MCFTEKASSSSEKTTTIIIIIKTYQVSAEEISEKGLQSKALESSGK